MWWSGVTVTCFAASYLVSLLLEISRLFFRAPVRLAIMIGFSAAGLVAHAMYLAAQAHAGAATGAPLSSWRDWCLILAWFLALTNLIITVRRPRNPAGLFLLPLVLALIGLAVWVYGPEPFRRPDALVRWGMVHGVALLMGTAMILLGFLAGVMYLAQSYRLKHKLPVRQGFRLPSLERLQRVNKQALYCSAFFIAVGLASGIVLNMIKGVMAWTNLVIVASAVLLAWLAVILLLEFFYRPARQGRKVAYLTIVSFVLLGLVLAFVLYTRHARSESADHVPAQQSQAAAPGAADPAAANLPTQRGIAARGW